MKPAYRVLFFLSLCFLISNSLYSQTNKHKVSKGAEELSVHSLDEIQRDQLNNLKYLYEQKQDRILKNTEGEEEMATKLQRLRDQYQLQVSKILSKGQFEKWKAMQPHEQNILLTNNHNNH
ncbi:MAG: hypothetical protein HKN16_08085 [Saprospiraceae bacterium]|nr:hypothetical protein [Saprospiraceae bacterium]